MGDRLGTPGAVGFFSLFLLLRSFLMGSLVFSSEFTVTCVCACDYHSCFRIHFYGKI